MVCDPREPEDGQRSTRRTTRTDGCSGSGYSVHNGAFICESKARIKFDKEGIFGKKGFNVQEMVALTGAHTVGFAHCSEFANRIFNFSKTQDHDPSMNPRYVDGLKKLCANYKKDSTIAAFNDPISPGKFDNTYYVNLQRGLGLLASDQIMATDPRTKKFVDLYAKDQKKFFEDFAAAMEKVGVLDVKTGEQGEIRKRCDTPNTLKTN